MPLHISDTLATMGLNDFKHISKHVDQRRKWHEHVCDSFRHGIYDIRTSILYIIICNLVPCMHNPYVTKANDGGSHSIVVFGYCA